MMRIFPGHRASWAPLILAALLSTSWGTRAAAQAVDDTPPTAAGAARSEPTAVPQPIAQALLSTGLPLSSLSVWVQPMDQGMPRLTLAGDEPRLMASVMKLITTGVALRTLGPAHGWQTLTALSGRLDQQGVLHGDVHIKASGDPSLDGMRLMAALQQWRDAGLREIRGDVIVDRSVMLTPPHDSAAFDGEALKPYNAGPDAWLIAHGATSLMWRPDSTRPGQVRVSLSPPLAGIALDTQVRLDPSAPCGAWREAMRLTISEAPAVPEGTPLPGRTLRLRGSYPAACGAQAWPLLWPQAQTMEHSARVLEATWQQLGGRLKGSVREGPWPVDATVWATWASPSLTEVVRDINKYSNNVMARQVFLSLGRGADGQANALAQAQTLVAQHVREATRRTSQAQGPCDGTALVLDNGSGLSRTEAASARCMARWIEVMWADPLMPEWLASLPVAGVDGTARRMGSAVGRAHLKTGSLEGVTGFAGVVQDDAGRRHAVVAVVNDPKASQARPVLQAVLAWAASNQGAP